MSKYLLAAICTIIATSISFTVSGNGQTTQKLPRVISSFETKKPVSDTNEETSEKEETQFPTVRAFEKEMIQIAAKAQESCVRIISLTKPTKEKPDNYKYVNFSGLIVRKDGFILTLAQPLLEADTIVVNMNQKSYNATLWASDKETQLAIIKIDEEDLPVPKFADSSKIHAGSIVVFSGNPYNLNNSVKFTTVSGTERIMYINGIPNYGVFQIDTSTNPGEPGGPCLDSDGKLMGILWSSYIEDSDIEDSVTAEKIMRIVDRIVKPEMKVIARQVILELLKELSSKYGSSSLYENEGISFVLPSNQLKKVSGNLIEFKKIKKAYVGIKIDNDGDLETGVQTFKIREVTPDSPAEKYGLKVGDEIIKVEGKPFTSLLMIYKILSLKNPGDKLELTIIRDKTVSNITLVLGEYPE